MSEAQHSTQVLNSAAVFGAMERTLAMIQFDLQGNVLWANENFAKSMGYLASEMSGMTHRQFCTKQLVESPSYAALWDNLQSFQALQRQANTIKGIVGTIRDIAAQTNLLALNAAIEAAHAGEFGRGFDIVAKEVRMLAKQVEDATREVSRNVEAITEQVTMIGMGTNRSNAAVADSRRRIEQALDEFTASERRQNCWIVRPER